MMESVIAYIRSWFPISPTNRVSRKRRAPENLFKYGSPKHRKILSPMSTNFEDDWIYPSPFASSRPILNNLSSGQTVIINDDDDDLIEIIGPTKRRKSKYTSTPSENTPKIQLNGGDDDVILVGKLKSTAEKKRDAKKVNCSYITHFSRSFDPITVKLTNGHQSKQKISPITTKTSAVNEINKKKTSNPQMMNSSLDYSIRLDDKLKYKELLDKLHNSSSNASNNRNSSVYFTPPDKFSSYNSSSGNRGKKMVNMALNKSPITRDDIDFIDLTSDNNKSKLSTKDTVIKILDDFDNAVVVDPEDEVEDKVVGSDGDSDVEILPTPPSPKPDIKVERVNSLKKLVDTSKSTHPNHIKSLYDDHCRFIKSRQKEIDNITEQALKLNKINEELRIESLSRKVHKCLAIKEAVLPIEEWEKEIPLPELTNDHLRLINRGLNGDPNEIIIKKFNMNISRRDIQTLDGLTWLNDNVINFYMNLIIERGKETKWPKSHCMNTFFYQKLIKDGPESLRRWTRRIDIFSNDVICIPIHLGIHWCMAIIYLNERSIKYYDSMGGSNNQCLQALRNYLEYEHMDKKKETYDTDDFILENVKDIPQQMNGSDCGVFSCTFAEFASRKSKFNFSQENMPYLRKKMIFEILSGELMIQ